MNKIESFNEYAFNKLKGMENMEDIANPLLVSPKCNGNIMYIGQETNGWYGSIAKTDYSCEFLTYNYENYLNGKVRKTPFWNFIKDIYGEEFYKDVVWTNSLIVGKACGKGVPTDYERFIDLSVENLLTIYEYFGIDKIICTGGPYNPYKKICKMFFDEIGKNIDMSLNVKDGVIYSDDQKVLYTYHPQYLKQAKIYNKVLESAKEIMTK